MIQVKPTILSKILKSKKDFLFFNVDDNNKLIDYRLTNDYKYRLTNEYTNVRVISTIQKEHEFIKL
jgi:hypothetical protein